MKQIYSSLVPPTRMRIEEVAARFNARVEWTAPYWPECQPVELFNNNLKADYKDRDHDERDPNVGEAVFDFCCSVPTADAQRWVEKTDIFCRAVCERDESVLTPLILELLPF